jgi:hypothetical protein
MKTEKGLDLVLGLSTFCLFLDVDGLEYFDEEPAVLIAVLLAVVILNHFERL